MKIHVLYKFIDGPWGGANQFLKELKRYFVEKKLYTDDPRDADIILFNSDQRSVRAGLRELYMLTSTTNAVMVNRVDGPIALRNIGFERFDTVIADLNNVLFDGCVFQSEWSFLRMHECAEALKPPHVVIHNGASRNLFYPRRNGTAGNNERIKIIATSWSKNYRAKGFDIYEYLDNNLDLTRYAMTFVGHSPIEFKNIRKQEPVDSETLGTILREHDIYITASINDPCSNALIEGLVCGLPAVVRNSGGHPELIGKGGVVFNDTADIIKAIDTVAADIAGYKEHLPVFDFCKVANEYLEFFDMLLSQRQKCKSCFKQINIGRICLLSSARLRLFDLGHSMNNKFKGIKQKMRLGNRSCCQTS
ncbi:MAG: glycosyltransferase family 4 protein [Candidatus Omnitrophica bacterium]|nr:glycosyltransferase family 4 protein [Candidatus Omnitrophota bacterium]